MRRAPVYSRAARVPAVTCTNSHGCMTIARACRPAVHGLWRGGNLGGSTRSETETRTQDDFPMTETTSSYPDTRLLIAGEWRDATGGRKIAVANPATGQTIGHVAHASIADLDAALAGARR